MKKNYYLLFVFLFVTLSSFSQSLVINEIITSNSTVNTDDDGSYEDWVELYNGSAESINLEGYGLTDNTNPFKWVFPSKTILPGEHLLVWCSEKNRINPDLPLHTNFKISADGETITLTHSNGTTIDAYATVVIPQNYTYGRLTDGADSFAIFIEPTPGASNTTQGYTDILDAPQFSVASGFYENSLSLDISSEVEGATIIYTLDGSEPDENNLNGTTYQYKNQYPQNPGDSFGPFLEQNFISYSYTGSITIQDRNNEANKLSVMSSSYESNPYFPSVIVPKSTVVRAKAIKPGALPSPVVTQNYFISGQGSAWFSLPVIAISTDEDNLFDYTNGIFVAGTDYDQWRTEFPEGENFFSAANYKRSGAEIKGNFSYYNAGNEIANQDVDLRINGNYSRWFSNKSFRIYAREEYGNGSLDYPFFGAGNDGFKTIILRNSGNDINSTYFRDAFIQTSVSHLNIDTQGYRPTVVFVNGEHWGLLNLTERYDKHYFKRHYDIEDDALDYLEIAGQLSAKEGSTDHYLAMINYIENNPMQDDANYAYIKTQLDPENLADYFISEIFSSNTDWPGNNMEFYRKKTTAYNPGAPAGNDGRWRWMLKDTDGGFGDNYEHNTLAHATGSLLENPDWTTFLIRNMLTNTEFKNYFINRFADLLNTTFLPSRMQTVFNTLKTAIEPEMQGHINRWGATWSMQNWNNQCNVVVDYINERPSYQRDHIRQEFAIQQNINATLNISDDLHGYIAINTININGETEGVQENPYPWTGIYFQDIPVTLKAVALPGYTFSHWTGDVNSTEAVVTFTPTQNFNVKAHFVPADLVVYEEPIYYWMFDGDVANDTALINLNATFSVLGNAIMQYNSCLTGYPFTSASPNWRKASMERRNSPTVINYIPEANGNVAFNNADMKGIQIKQPFQRDGLENTVIFNIPSTGYKDIKFAFALKDEDAASGVLIDYSVSDNPAWITTGLSNTPAALSQDYQLYEADFSDTPIADDNVNLKVRLRFTGNNVTVDNGDRVTLNNVSVHGTSVTAGINKADAFLVKVYPNPVADVLTVSHLYDKVNYALYSIDGKLVNEGILQREQINMGQLQSGIYLLKLHHNGKVTTRKIVKQ